MEATLISRGKKPRRGVVKPCEVCGTEFYALPARAESAKFCSRTCRNASVEQEASKTCLKCGKVFTLGGAGRHYCTQACYSASRVPRKNCKLCGVPLKVIRLTYCSRTCRDKARTTRLEKACETCGKVFEHKAHRDSKFCSTECRIEGHRLKGSGHKFKNKDGYTQVYYPLHPDARGNGCVAEHRLVMEKVLGRRLRRDEQIHHINEDKADNRPENLQIISVAAHASLHAKKRKERDELEEYRKRFGPLP